MLTSGLAMEEISKVHVLTDRVQKRKQEYENAHPCVSSLRARVITESWKETEADPFHIRRAKAFARILKESPVIIRDGELIVGSETKYIRGAEAMPEFNTHDILHAIQKAHFDGLSEVITASIEEEEGELLEEAATYWVGKSTGDIVREALRRELGQEYLDLLDDEVRVIECPLVASPKPSSFFNPRVLKEGLNHTIARARGEKEKITRSIGNAPLSQGGYHKIVVLNSIIIACEAVIEFANRHAELARSMAKTETDLVRKRELEKIGEHCDWVPTNPARTFAEALQSLWFVHLALKKETPPGPACLGRLDQYLYPYYERDLKEGRITCQEAAELLGLLWVKLNELEAFRGRAMTKWGSGSLLQQVTISGQTKEGRDATNELSYLILKVCRQLGMPQPGVYIRYHNGISQEFLIEAVETNRDIAGGIPAFLSDQSAVNRLMALGVERNDAIEWSAGGCLNFVVGHVQSHPRGVAYLNEAKVLEITLNNGVDPRTGKLVGLQTGDVTKFACIEELYKAWEKQYDWFVDKAVKMSFIGQSTKVQHYSTPMTTALLDDCIEKGLDAYEGGERYPQLSYFWGHRGQVDVADSLTAIKKLVFEDKKITMAELLGALAANFEGKDDLRQMCLQAPKYGNDDDYADDIFNYVGLKGEEIMLSKCNPWTGKPLCIHRLGVASHYYYGEVVGALPNGREAWLPLCDGALSPMQGADVKGPTALINSATKVDHTPPEQNGLILNMKFSRSMLQTRGSLEQFLALLKTFFDRDGWHIQFNIVSREDLLEAQKHPEQWGHLLVRVAGYSAYFVDLPRALQNEIIARSEHLSCSS